MGFRDADVRSEAQCVCEWKADPIERSDESSEICLQSMGGLCMVSRDGIRKILLAPDIVSLL